MIFEWFNMWVPVGTFPLAFFRATKEASTLKKLYGVHNHHLAGNNHDTSVFELS
jgi:hypothetical protein